VTCNRESRQFDVCVTVHHRYKGTNNKLDATITIYIVIVASSLLFILLYLGNFGPVKMWNREEYIWKHCALSRCVPAAELLRHKVTHTLFLAPYDASSEVVHVSCWSEYRLEWKTDTKLQCVSRQWIHNTITHCYCVQKCNEAVKVVRYTFRKMKSAVSWF